MAIGSFPARGMIAGWLKAGVFEAGQRVRADRGGNSTGRRDFPVPAEYRVARAGGGRRGPIQDPARGPVKGGCPALRYADNLVVSVNPGSRPSRSRHGWPSGWRREGWRSTKTKRGSSPSVRGSTSSGSTSAATQRQANDQAGQGGHQAVPGKACDRDAHLARLERAAVAEIIPVIRGWAAYYRGVVSSKVFHSLDTYLWRLTYKWAWWRHRNKPRSWVVGRVLRQVQCVQERPLGVR